MKVSIYVNRRKALKERVKSGVILIWGNSLLPMNYPDNTYHFRQDSSFLYFYGLDKPDLVGMMDLNNDVDILFGTEKTVEDVVWEGYQPSLKELAEVSGVSEAKEISELSEMIKNVKEKQIHILPPYRSENKILISDLFRIPFSDVKNYVSETLINAVIQLRSKKSKEEIQEIESALNITREFFIDVAKMAKPGIPETNLVGTIENVIHSKGTQKAYPIILSTHGEVLHNHEHSNILKENDLLLIDAGSESLEKYASDITRTFPVGGKFTEKQKAIYNLVLKTQMTAIESIKPGVKNRDIHLQAAKTITTGLKELGLLKGDVDEMVEKGVHALFFPHGLGHMLGLDVHDMENLGENQVGYNGSDKRSDQFGLKYLRLAKPLEPGFVITVEPGIYFIPTLIEKWKSENKNAEHIIYSEVEKYKDFGGIRIEDDVLVTENGHQVLGPHIPKTVDEIESLMS